MMRHHFVRAVMAVALLSAQAPVAWAQSQDYFIPGQGKPAPSGGGPAPRPGPRQAPRPSGPTTQGPSRLAPPPVASGVPPLGITGQGEGQDAAPPLNVELPPPPDLPPLAKGEAPPVAVIGVMGVPEVMRASAAAQQVEKVIGERRNKLNEDAQKEQAAWQEMQKALASDRVKLSPEQVHARERELQERITNAQRQFRDRNRVIQEAAQYALAQIERTLIAVIRQVAEARGMNLVLHRAQVALNVNQFDITDQVAEQLNKILPTVLIPPDGVSPTAMQPTIKPPPAKAPPPVEVAPAPAPAPAAAAAPPPPAAPAPTPPAPPATPAPPASASPAPAPVAPATPAPAKPAQ
jgi:Skp family chaperone for outer membrane proteins